MICVNSLRCSIGFAGLLLVLEACSLSGVRTSDLLISVPYSQQSDPVYILVTIPLDYAKPVTRAGSTRKYHFRSNIYAQSPRGVQTIDRLTQRHNLRAVTEWPISPLDIRCIVFEVLDRLRTEQILSALKSDDQIESVQRLNTFYVRADNYNDPYYPLQHGLQSMQIVQAHLISQGKGVKVAVVDTGIDDRHTDLSGKVQVKKNFVSNRAEFNNDIHGTAVAGIIASEVNNKIGIAGMAPRVKLMALKACQPFSVDASEAACNSFTLAQAITYAIENNAQVLNLSLSGPQDPLLKRLIEVAHQRGIIVVSAFDRCDSFPAGLSSVIVVGAIENSDMPYCSIMSERMLWAPGVNVMTTLPGDRYNFMSGNSFAAAHLSGVIALLMEHSKELSSLDILQLLNPSASQNTRQFEKPRQSINACAALRKITGQSKCIPETPSKPFGMSP